MNNAFHFDTLVKTGITAFGLSLWLLLPGCGRGDLPALALTKGIVKLNGQPLAAATVRFQPVANEGTYSTAVTNHNGEFELKYNRKTRGAILGKHLVTITTGHPDNENENGEPAPIPEILPDIYHKKSTLNEEVVVGKNYFEYDLEPRKPLRK